MKCPKCNHDHGYSPGEHLARSAQCNKCGQDLKICTLCEFYDTSAQWNCREHISEPVLEKEKPNFCDYFKLGHQNATSESKSKQNMFDVANALFKK